MLEKHGPLVGRILIAVPLLSFGWYKTQNFEMMSGWMRFLELPAPSLLLGAAIAFELVGGLLLIAGYKTRWAALALILYIIPVTFVIHSFWSVEDLVQRQAALESFSKGIIIIGGLLFVATFGAGPVSVDGRAARKAELSV
ncbi:MAG: DoxX family protein [Gemmatimonadota bacterium]